MQVEIRKKLANLAIEKRAFINGQYCEAIHGQTLNRISPIDGSDISGLCSCDSSDVDKAIDAAKSAYDTGTWRSTSPAEKKQILLKLADLMETNREQLALLDTLETGRAFKNFYQDSIPKAIEALRYFAESLDKYYDHAIPPRPNDFALITREPLGVVGLITPWNDPMVVSIWKIAPALAMGNSVVVKPAEQSSFSILHLARLAKQAGIPDGVLNIIPGPGEIAGRAIALHNDVAAIFFTGSSEVGKQILQYSGQSNMKKVGLECGGKSAFIVSRNCQNLAEAAAVLAKNIFYNQGQICSAPSRAIVEHDIWDEFLILLRAELNKYTPHDPFDTATEVGCLVSKMQRDRILEFVSLAEEEGKEIYVADEPTDMNPLSVYALPTIVVENDATSHIAQNEIFGPVLVLMRTETLGEAIRIANNTRFGLAASIWTDKLDEAYQVSRSLHAGIVHINCYGDDDNTVPFGGVGESGIGKDKSIFAFDEYSYLKTTWIHARQLHAYR